MSWYSLDDSKCQWLPKTAREKIIMASKNENENGKNLFEPRILDYGPESGEWIIIVGEHNLSDQYIGSSKLIYTFLIYVPTMKIILWSCGSIYTNCHTKVTHGPLLMWTKYSFDTYYYTSPNLGDLSECSNDYKFENDGDDNKILFVYPHRNILKFSDHSHIIQFNLPCTILYFKTVANSLNSLNSLMQEKSNSGGGSGFPNDLVLLIMQYLYVKYKPVDLEALYLNAARFGLDFSVDAANLDINNERYLDPDSLAWKCEMGKKLLINLINLNFNFLYFPLPQFFFCNFPLP